LAAVAAGMIDVDAQVFFVDFDFVVGFYYGEDFDEGEGGLSQIIGVEGREADEAVDAMFGF